VDETPLTSGDFVVQHSLKEKTDMTKGIALCFRAQLKSKRQIIQIKVNCPLSERLQEERRKQNEYEKTM
jgi:hypothetical protein